MADEPIVTPAAPVSASSTPAAAPASAPVTTPASEPAPAASPVPSAAPVIPVEGVKPAESALDPVQKLLASDEPTLLETLDGKGAEKVLEGDKKGPEDDLKPDSAQNTQNQPEKFTFQPFTPPEGAQLDTNRISVLDNVLNERLGPQEQRDKLLNMHIEEMKAYDTQLRQQQQDAFRDTRRNWIGQIKADPELGGSGFNTTKANVAEMRDLFASRHRAQTEGYIQDMAEFNHMLRYTGAGDHPAFWRFLNNVARKFKEPAAPPAGDFKPPPDLGRKPGKAGRSGALYDHPSSHINRGR